MLAEKLAFKRASDFAGSVMMEICLQVVSTEGVRVSICESCARVGARRAGGLIMITPLL